jgi:hypothetical protein
VLTLATGATSSLAIGVASLAAVHAENGRMLRTACETCAGSPLFTPENSRPSEEEESSDEPLPPARVPPSPPALAPATAGDNAPWFDPPDPARSDSSKESTDALRELFGADTPNSSGDHPFNQLNPEPDSLILPRAAQRPGP